MISSVDEKQSGRPTGRKKHWPDAWDCPVCGNNGAALQFRGLCSHTEMSDFPVHDTWLECPSCGRRGKPVRKSLFNWYQAVLSDDDLLYITAIENWNRG